MAAVPPRRAYRFGDCRFEPHNARLILGDEAITLSPRALELLSLLVQQPNVLLTKDALMSAVWRDVAVDENNLTQQISALRKLLGQSDGREFIETVPRLGYRFVAPVVVEDEVASAAPLMTPSAVPAHARAYGRGLGFVGVAAAIATGIALWQWRAGSPSAVEAESNAYVERARERMRASDAPAAVAELQKAIEINPRNAVAHSTLAHALHTYGPRTQPREPATSPVLAAARRGVELDPACGPCHGTLGFYLFSTAWQWAEAESHLVEALRLAPDVASIRPSYALLLAGTGRLDEALQQIDLALAKDPLEIGWLGIRASILYLQRRYPDAVAASDRGLAINDKDRNAWEWRSRALFALGRGEDAIQALAHVAFAPNSADLERAVKAGQTRGGLVELLRITSDWTHRDAQAWRRAPWLMHLHDYDAALTELEVMVKARSFNAIYLGVDPVFDPVRQDPRFLRVIEAIGLGGHFGAPSGRSSDVVRGSPR